MGDVSTFYVRFKWEGATIPDTNNNCVVLMNGYAWATNSPDGITIVTNYVGKGYGLKIMTVPGQPGKGYFNVFVPGKTTPPVGSCSSYYAIDANRWVDVFVSVYPSALKADLSNADVWYCQEPAIAGGSYRDVVFRHRHFGDDYGLPKMNAEERFVGAVRSKELRFGCEKITGYSNALNQERENCISAFRGHIAGAKGWPRMLSENEMWSVMLDRFGGVFDIGVVNNSSAEFCSNAPVAKAVYNTATNHWYELRRYLQDKEGERSITIEVPLPKKADLEPVSAYLPETLELYPIFDGMTASDQCFVTVSVNGNRVCTRNLKSEVCRRINLRGTMTESDSKMTIVIERPVGCVGKLSFDALTMRGGWKFGSRHNTEGWINPTSSEFCENSKGVAPVVMIGDPERSHVHQLLTWFYPTASILFTAPEDFRGYVYETETCNLGFKNGETSFPARLELNGEKIWPTDSDWKNFTTELGNQAISLEIPTNNIVKGLNELKWVYNYDAAAKEQNADSSYMGFDYHLIRAKQRPAGLVTVFGN
jgi:hypothetical protein